MAATRDVASVVGERAGLAREMSLAGLVATGVCSMVGAGINVLPFMIQRNVPGIGPHVLPAYALSAVPAVLAALAYAALASAMPRAGGSYVYASRALGPLPGFVAGFSQWLGLSFAMGVVAYLLPPFLRDLASALGLPGLADALDGRAVRLLLALGFLWAAAILNLLGIRTFQRAVVVLMALALVGGAIAVPAGFAHDHEDFRAALAARDGVALAAAPEAPLALRPLLAAVAILFSSFIGFDSIAQAGGEARDAGRALPRAIAISVLGVGAFYIAFTAAIYHAVPWWFIAERAQSSDLTAPGLLGYLLAPELTAAIVAAAAVALYNSLPGMMLAVSRLVFAWAEDGVVPTAAAAVHPRWRTPHVAIGLSTGIGTIGVLGCHLAGDFFLGVDLLVTGMLVNFALICLSLLVLPSRNPGLAAEQRFLRGARGRLLVGGAGTALLLSLLAVQVAQDLAAVEPRWFFHSTWAYGVAVAVAVTVFWLQWARQRRAGVDLAARFASLPPH